VSECSAVMKLTANERLIERAQRLLCDVDFYMPMRYTFEVRESHGGVFMQASYIEPDSYTGIPEVQRTRKWLISPEMTDSEIVSTAFKCCLTSSEHRCREAFKYKERRIYSPHYNVEDLVRLCETAENAGGRQ
jgi:hypothetical protein